MKLIRSLDDLPTAARGGAVSIGNFDGVHSGHIRLIERLCANAAKVGGPAVVFTFDPHPVRILQPEQCPPPLTWTERKAELLDSKGIDWIVAYPTDTALLGLSARQFFDQIVCQSLDAKVLVEGPNFYFGKDREGDVALLRRLSEESAIDVEIAEPLYLGGQVVSSSRIRRLVAAGDVGGARGMLSSPYRLRGMVTHGAGRGTKLGFPTANLVGIDTLLPAAGVYAGRGWLGDNSWPAAINIGPNPTFGVETFKVEAHLIGRAEPLYGCVVEVDFLERLRDIQTFGSADELIHQLKQDVAAVGEIVAGG